MKLEKFKKLTEEERKEYGRNIPLGETYNKYGNQSRYKDSDEDWYETTHDDKGNLLTFIDDDGFWWEREMNDRGKESISYRDSNGIYKIKGEWVSKEEFDEFIKENK